MKIQKDLHKTLQQNNFYLKGKMFCWVNKITEEDYINNPKVIESCNKSITRLRNEEERRK